MNKLKKAALKIRSLIVPVTGFAVASVVPVNAHAALADTINAAFTNGASNIGLAAAGLISMVAVVTGVSMIVNFLRR